MVAMLRLIAALIANLFKSRRRLEAENLFLRHQLNIAVRGQPSRLPLRGSDRALLVWMTRLWPSLLGLARVVEPATILRWHRAGFRPAPHAVRLRPPTELRRPLKSREPRSTSLRSHHRIPIHRPQIAEAEGWMNLSKAAARLGISAKILRIAAERGHIDAVHPLGEGPWLCNRSVLDTEEAQRLVERVRERQTPAGHLVRQPALFKSTT